MDQKLECESTRVEHVNASSFEMDDQAPAQTLSIKVLAVMSVSTEPIQLNTRHRITDPFILSGRCDLVHGNAHPDRRVWSSRQCNG